MLECRALLELYRDLRVEHTAWVQRFHAVLFHQSAGALTVPALRSQAGLVELSEQAADLSSAGKMQVVTALEMLAVLDERLTQVRRQLLHAARHLKGCPGVDRPVVRGGADHRVGVCCWLADACRFSWARKAVRFAGLDVTVHSSDGKRSPGHLSRQGPSVLRWCLYEAGKTQPGAVPRTTLTTRRSGTASTVTGPPCPRLARSSGRPVICWSELGGDTCRPRVTGMEARGSGPS